MIALAKESYNVRCVHCNQTFTIEAYARDIERWNEGVLCQYAPPYLSESERELLISGTCDDCWKAIFGDDEDFEDDEE